MTTIQIELCQEDRARLDAIIKALESKAATGGATTQAEEKKPTAAQIQSLGESIANAKLPWEEPKQEPKKETTFKPDMEAIRKLAIDLSNGGKKELARSIVNKYAKSIPAINPADYPAVYNELKQAIKDAIKGV